ncbi:MAG: helix-turn-helix transcriptional regulator [Myxococcales bacterium]|nr:helix-turn-helix transcriptional regulator [Myxococcales bacterium]
MGERSRSPQAQQARAHVAGNLHRLRVRRGLTQAQLAERLGIEVRHLQFIEAAESAPGFDLLVDLAAELEVAVGDLFEEAETPARRRGRPPKA